MRPATGVGLCSCGSGLRFRRCCGYDFADAPPPESVRPLLPLAERAQDACNRLQFDAAEPLALEILELAPNQASALWTLSRVRLAQNAQGAAEVLLFRYVTLYPNDVGPTCELARLLRALGKLEAAEIHARNAVRAAPTDPAVHNVMGLIMTDANRLRVGEFHFRRVLELGRVRDSELLANLARNLTEQGRIEEARALFEESLAATPDSVQALLGWSRLEEADRNFARAGELLDQAEALAPAEGAILHRWAILHGRTKQHEKALRALTGSPERRGLGPHELLLKGRILDRLGRYDEAFAAFQEGKQQIRETTGQSYADQEASHLIRRLAGFFQASRLSFTPAADVTADGAQPIFILGFPRSGTTLVEQILTSHPGISAGDELPIISDMARLVPRMLNSPLSYPEALSELWMGDQQDAPNALRDYYLKRVAQLGIVAPGRRWFTDKMPLNETHLGLIALLFPQAPLIHVIRHPLDVVLSALSHHLTHGFHCASGLATAAHHYVKIMGLVEHYKKEMSLRYTSLRYEDVIDDQEGSVRRLLNFVGEEYDPRCLLFHENRRYARTASYAQVAEPLYDSSCFRYRHYRRHLRPAAKILAPVIERLGYNLEDIEV